MKINSYSDDEINKKIEDEKLDITQPQDYFLEDITFKYSAQNNAMFEVSLKLLSRPDKKPVKDWILVESNIGLHILKFKRFMQSLGLENLYMSGEVTISDILASNRTGQVKLNEVDTEFTDKSGKLVKTKKLVVEEYFINPTQDTPKIDPEFNDDIPF